MTSASLQKARTRRKTTNAVFATNLFSTPLLQLTSLVAVILYKDLNANALQVTIFTMLKPMVAILSLYWSFSVGGRRDRLLPNVLWGGLLGRLPFFFFPFIDNPWWVILATALYMMLYRGVNPAWMEILKLNLPPGERSRVYSLGAAFGYGEGILIAIGTGWIMDGSAEAWRWLFPLAATLGFLGTLSQALVPVPVPVPGGSLSKISDKARGWKEGLIQPWKDSFRLLKERPDFAHFQWGFFFAGFGLMVAFPALPFFFVDELGLSYTDLVVAFAMCKGIGYVLTARSWGSWMEKVSLFHFSSWVFFLFGLFPLVLLAAKLNIIFLYLAYLIYGVAQAGSHLCWNMSGPCFAKDEDSSPYSSVNVVMVGVRACLGPPLGGILCHQLGPIMVLAFAFGLCCLSAFKMAQWGHELTPKLKAQS